MAIFDSFILYSKNTGKAMPRRKFVMVLIDELTRTAPEEVFTVVEGEEVVEGLVVVEEDLVEEEVALIKDHLKR
ncbi:hypothetical protein J6590_077966 [Homalodisca vitripennis]|nr:hypothetical protein J6590_077966 [Homalodisca vitripennis]